MKIENEQDEWPPVWTYRLIAGMHFLRLLGLLTVVLLMIFEYALYSTGFDPLLLTSSLPLIILDFLFGFLILMRENKVIIPVTIYVSIIGIPFLLMSLVMPPLPIAISLLGYSFSIESILIAVLGLMWIKREWVYENSD